MRVRHAAILAAGVCAALLPVGVPAQQLVNDGSPIVVEANTLDVHNAEGFAVYEGRVDAIQDDIQIRAERVELYFDGPSREGAGIAEMGALQRIEAIGGVYYVTPDQTASGDRAVYELATDTITLTGNVVVQQGCDVLSGASMVMNLTTGDAQVRSASGSQVQAGDSAPSGRVRTVIYSDDEAAAQADCAR